MVWSGGVILAQLVAQPSCVDAHDWICRGAEVRALAIQLGRQYLLFELIAMTIERLLDDEFQKG